MTATIDPQRARTFRSRLSRWGAQNRRELPWRGEPDPFKVLIAELLLQRSRGKTVAKVYRALFARWPSADALARARQTSIASVIRPVGLTGRARTIKALARDVVARGGVPRAVDDMLELPGVGPYVANATAAVAFGQRAPVVDGVTARVYRRYFGLPAETPPVSDRRLWEVVAELTPRRGAREWNWAVLDLAADVCLPRIPRCPECPLRAGCAWSAGSRAESSHSSMSHRAG